MPHEARCPECESSSGCYCFMWETQPEHFESEGIPRGYCGVCGLCGKPGHTRPHPNAPVTGAWCDACYAELAKTTPLWKVVRAVICVALFAWVAFLLWRGAR